ncbi:MAG: UDP-N-acetylmuramate--alanine ligase [Proteobacteria bacterium]|nr:UDP-N-acetylmuramate--alanine ligase [Pseudomonadota bacterium]
MAKVHFIGAAGAGVSALAQYHVMGGGAATGSDRNFDRGEAGELRAQLEALGVVIKPQDGSALDGSHAYAVASAAVEDDTPEMRRAREIGLKVMHRADCLAEHVAGRDAIAVAGTSGKSTVVAMVFEILEAAGKGPSVITGGALLALKQRGLVGNAFKGASDLLVVEADESDGTLVRYAPWLGVVLNLSKDHREPEEVRKMFASFRSRCKTFVAGADAAAGLGALARDCVTFGFESGDVRATDVRCGPEGSRFSIEGVEFSIPTPGKHNVENALAAVAASREAGVGLAAASRALSSYKGVARRFERVGAVRGVEVIDDFAHNPAKVEAAIAAAHLRSRRVLAVFQLHGFAPARFMRAEFVDSFSRALKPADALWMPEIYYAGGTAAKDISARDIAAEIAARGRDARFASREEIAAAIAREAKPGDCVMVMGARDPSLSAFARSILSALGAA